MNKENMEYNFENVWKHCSAVKEHVMYDDSLFYRGTYQELEGDEISIIHGVYVYVPRLSRKIDINIIAEQDYGEREYYKVYLEDLLGIESEYTIDTIGLSQALCKCDDQLDIDDYGNFLYNGFKKMLFDEAKIVVNEVINALINMPEERINKYINVKEKK